MESLFIQNEITINASVEKVWDLLTKSEFTKKYMFGCEAVTDWKQGSSLLWKGQLEGKDVVFVKGDIVEIDAPNLLIYSVIDPHSKTVVDIPENYLNVSYRLTKKGDRTLLEVKQGDYKKVQDGEQRYAESYNGGKGWMPILLQIKTIAEEK